MTKAVAVLGTGIMGAGMARSLIRAGLDVTVWNRSADKARPLDQEGARVVEDAASAVSGADVVLTMLFDADAVAAVMEQALPAVDRSALWVQTSTVGLDGTARLARLADRHGVGFIDAPVLGTRKPAEEGALIVLAAGPRNLREAVAQVFDAIGSRIVWVGERAGDGHRLKLVANSWVLSVVGAIFWPTTMMPPLLEVRRCTVTGSSRNGHYLPMPFYEYARLCKRRTLEDVEW
jgi:3-hydroxyisobutyrate dehydrogenase